MRRPFTGRDMAIVMVAGFGMVVAVNFYMAARAADSFGGVVVENSYVASQKFNGWLAKAQRGRTHGWKAQMGRDDLNHLVVETSGVPEGAIVRAELRRPLGDPGRELITLTGSDAGRFRSQAPLDRGRWIVRLEISDEADVWQSEGELR
ncbi:MAG: hypothetical protein C0510_06385 [Erythrobacter sp.]|nr:hypothetical protein [Erythrobacter sp.]